MDPEMPWLERSPNFPAEAHACSSFISQYERMSESPVETLQKALGLHLISKKGLTWLWQLESHVEFTASNVDDAWQFFNIVRNPNITVSNRKRDLNYKLNSRTVRTVCHASFTFLSCPSYLDRCPDFTEQTPVSYGHPARNLTIYPRLLPQHEKTHETFPSLRDEARFRCIVSRAIAFSQSNT